MHQYISLAASSILHRVYILSPVMAGRLAPQDGKLLSVCHEYGIPTTIVLSKCDAVRPTEVATTILTIKDQTPPGVDIVPFSVTNPGSIDSVKMDFLHSVTKWLPVKDLEDLSLLQNLTYGGAEIDPDTLVRQGLKHRRNLTMHEENVLSRRAQGIDVSDKDWRYVVRQKNYDGIYKEELGKNRLAKVRAELPDLTGLIQKPQFTNAARHMQGSNPNTKGHRSRQNKTEQRIDMSHSSFTDNKTESHRNSR
eukprot:TRINITY_DN6497_c1_g1_i1.p1 TRINITY_DN6497_c1_g1~~TRINITY_DN6497_c1_g1_i1.p1  ORF type:complete len:251 (+),score=35.04 TRINITY_DN6497_c1_g1_i1:457-1209(+)